MRALDAFASSGVLALRWSLEAPSYAEETDVSMTQPMVKLEVTAADIDARCAALVMSNAERHNGLAVRELHVELLADSAATPPTSSLSSGATCCADPVIEVARSPRQAYGDGPRPALLTVVCADVRARLVAGVRARSGGRYIL